MPAIGTYIESTMVAVQTFSIMKKSPASAGLIVHFKSCKKHSLLTLTCLVCLTVMSMG